MNKKYTDPEMKITLFESIDVITASGREDFFDDLNGQNDQNEVVNNITVVK